MGKKGKRTFVLYYLSFDMAFCHGPVDELIQLYFKEKPVFEDGDTMPLPTSRDIDKYELFGGDEREGGIVGRIYYHDGSWTQMQSAEMCTRIGLEQLDAPGYRGIMHVALCGTRKSDRRGAIVAANSPSVPAMWARARRFPKGIPINNIVIVNSKDYTDVNPAAIIWEAVTNPDWGMGGDPESLNEEMFQYAASVLFDENLGLSFLWDAQSSIEDFIAEVLDHIDGLYYFNPFTGLAELKLLRNDYDRDNLPGYGPSNCALTSFRRKLWGETTNEITVNYMDCETEETGSVTYQDPGNASMQGEVKSETRTYDGCRTEELALYLAQRDLMRAAAPLASVNIRVDRRSWRHLPGAVIRFEWPDHGITSTILRVLSVDWGTLDKSEIKVELIEDIFAFQEAEFGWPGGGEWEDPVQDPELPVYEKLPALFFALPFTLIQQDMPPYFVDQLTDDKYPQIVTGALVARTDEQQDLMSFVMHVPDTTATGSPTWTSVGEKQLSGRAMLDGVMLQEVISIIKFDEKVGGDGPEEGRYAIIGPAENEYRHEWILFEEELEDGEWRVLRGVLDTVPAEWNTGTVMWFISESWDAHDMGNSFAFELERYKLQARTSQGLRNLDNIIEHTTTRPDRPYLPYRPANCVLGETMFGLEDQTQIPEGTYEPREWLIPVTWSWRHRKLEDSIVRRWSDGNVALEDNQTTTILSRSTYNNDVLFANKDSGTIVSTLGNLSDDNLIFDIWEHTARYEKLNLKFISERNDLVSLQGIRIDLGLYIKGYGSDWGYAYGGWKLGPTADIATGIFDMPLFEFDGAIEED